MNETNITSFVVPQMSLSSFQPQILDLNKICAGFLHNGGSLRLGSEIAMVCAVAFLFFSVEAAYTKWKQSRIIGFKEIFLCALACTGLLFSFIVAVKIYVVGG